MNSLIYPIKHDDLKGCASCHAKSFPKPWSQQELESFLEKKTVLGYAVKSSEKRRVVGFILGMRCGERLEILTIAVDPEFRRQGVAIALLQKMKDHCQSEGIGSLNIEVSRNNDPAINLYERYGFKREGVRKNYYREEGPSGHQRVDAILYRFDVE